MEIEKKKIFHENFAEKLYLEFEEFLTLLGSEKTQKKGKEILRNLDDKKRTKTVGIFKKSLESHKNGNLVASCIYIINKNKSNLISFGMGTKSISKKKVINPKNQILDFHAEVLARNAFNLYLCNEYIYLTTKEEYKSDYFILKNKKIYLKKGLRISMLCSKMPCGDCSVFNHNREPKFKLYSNACLYSDYKETVENFKEKIPMEKGKNLDFQLRIKPIRKDTKASMILPCLSCTDKLMIWSFLGFQGEHLSHISEDLKIQEFILPFIELSEVGCEEIEDVEKEKIEKLLRQKISIALNFKRRILRLKGEGFTQVVERYGSEELEKVIGLDENCFEQKIEFFKVRGKIEKGKKNIGEVCSLGYLKDGKIVEVEILNQKNGLKMGGSLKHVENVKSLSKFRPEFIKETLSPYIQEIEKNSGFLIKKKFVDDIFDYNLNLN